MNFLSFTGKLETFQALMISAEDLLITNALFMATIFLILDFFPRG